MESGEMITDLVKSVAIKKENVETGGKSVAEDWQIVNSHVKLERNEPEDNSTDSAFCNTHYIKTEVSCDENFYDDRVSSSGEELQMDSSSASFPTDRNGTFQETTVGNISNCSQTEYSHTKDCLEGNSSNLQRREIMHSSNMEEKQNGSHLENDLFECVGCGLFFCDDANRSNQLSNSANVCSNCKSLVSSFEQRFIENISLPTCKWPCDKKWLGLYNFSVQVSPQSLNKTSFVYSSSLNKLYTTINLSIPIQFKCSWEKDNLCVRAIPVYTIDEVAEPVVRCNHHMRPSEETNIDFPHMDHVIRCQHDMCSYERDERSGRLSVVVPLGSPAPGSDVITVMYKFMCKNSCLGGMNRRPIEVIFTLETRSSKEVVGRDTLQVRVCSCPFRDMKREECRYASSSEKPMNGRKYKNRPAAMESCNHCKQPKLEEKDNVFYIPVCGDRSYFKKAVMLLRSNLIGEKLAAGINLTKEDHVNWKIFNRIISDIAEPSGS